MGDGLSSSADAGVTGVTKERVEEGTREGGATEWQVSDATRTDENNINSQF